ncbi:HI1506-related protein [Photobacterium sp.]|uniref:HI1506-related protein n=1 Tax=Photobacterium sp. TaxID=660 RepID=UPI00299DFB1C|nr:HI1506-related protein [Photobacterium sp.]MDX1301191.1 HI1506-related protein [Photobacterium sp.]
MEKCNIIDKKLVVKSVAHDGYRRAGMAFSAGENILAAGTVTCSQLAMLEADPRLAVSYAEAGASDDTPGALVQGRISDGVNKKSKAKSSSKSRGE